VKLTLIAKGGVSAAIACAGVLGVLVGCAVAWLVWSTHIPVHYPLAAFVPIGAVLTVYIAIVMLTLGRSTTPIALLLAVAILGALLTLVVGAVLNEMILCHYDRYACINL
jgi:hypothetical protein